jgi:two-component system invasion response regulator UvrY
LPQAPKKVQDHVHEGLDLVIRLLVVDDHESVRRGLKEVFGNRTDMQVSAEASSGEAAIALLRAQAFDVALVDLALPDMSGMDLLARIKAIRPEVAVLVVSGYPEEQYAINVLKFGGAGFVAKDESPENLVTAVIAAAEGRRYVSPRIAEKLVLGISGKSADAPPHTRLTEREFQILCRLAQGQSAAKIAADLFLSAKTVGTYRARILKKLGLKSTSDLTYYAVKNGLIA